jgi:glycosyltransferase involved in cell wall biosynthesis
MFGPPLEMFHCGGTAIVYNVTGHDEYIADRRNGVVIPRDDEERVIRTINKLRDDCAFLESLKQGARETGESWPDWPEASRVFMDQVLALAQRVGPTKGMLAGAAEVFSSWYEKHSSCQAQIAQLEGERSHLAQEVRAQRSQLDMILSSGSFRTMQRIRDSLGARVVKKLCGRAA